MLRRTSWDSSFISSEMRLSSCRWVTSRPRVFATGPRIWASAARTGCEGSMASDENSGRTCCWSWSLVNGSGKRRHCSTTRTASFRTSCSVSLISCLRGSIRCAAVISGPKAAHSWLKFVAIVSRTRHERSLAASLMAVTACCEFSSASNILAITRAVWTEDTRIVSCVSSWDSCLYTLIMSLSTTRLSQAEIRSGILWAAARLTMGVSSAHRAWYASWSAVLCSWVAWR
mmetsp:Transcript_110245/g.312747  ORF Transcript_110245/g.312747 Transcript_110245/m.312747 type:complete len:230 (-) Transcript_110245:527-1216(-)